MALNDEREKLKQAEEWLTTCEVSSQHYQAAWDHLTHVLATTQDAELREATRDIWWKVTMGTSADRGGAGGEQVLNIVNGVSSYTLRFPKTDGKGCPLCGAIRNGGHGGGCPRIGRYDENGIRIL